MLDISNLDPAIVKNIKSKSLEIMEVESLGDIIRNFEPTYGNEIYLVSSLPTYEEFISWGELKEGEIGLEPFYENKQLIAVPGRKRSYPSLDDSDCSIHNHPTGFYPTASCADMKCIRNNKYMNQPQTFILTKAYISKIFYPRAGGVATNGRTIGAPDNKPDEDLFYDIVFQEIINQNEHVARIKLEGKDLQDRRRYPKNPDEQPLIFKKVDEQVMEYVRENNVHGPLYFKNMFSGCIGFEEKNIMIPWDYLERMYNGLGFWKLFQNDTDWIDEIRDLFEV